MQYNFDREVRRKGTDSVKYDMSKKLFGTDEILPMWVADMDFEVPAFIRDAVLERAAHPVYGYTFRPGRFYETAAAWLKRRHDWDISPDSISFSPGIVPALNMIVMAFTDPGDRIVVQPPVYFPFFSAITNHERKLVHNRLVEHKGLYEIDFTQLEEEFRRGAKMLFFCHPHNPVGRVWSRSELEKLAELCVKYRVLVVSDEVHSDLVLFGNRHIPLASLGPELADLTLTCIAPSKSFNLAGLYTSAVIATQPELKKKYDRILDAVHVGGGNLFGQVAFEAAYKYGDEWLDQLIAYLERNFTMITRILEAEVPEIIISPLQATYLVWLDFSFLGKSDEELKQFMIEEAGLGLNEGSMFGPGGAQHQRMNIATPLSVIEKAATQLAEAIRAAG